jgi:hypothetical protein
MTPAEVCAPLDDRSVLALTAWAEARRVPRNIPSDHSPVEELLAVMVVVRNRRLRYARWRATDPSYKSICLAPSQFSCWNPDSGSNHEALMVLAEQVAMFPDVPIDDPLLRECLYLATGVMAGVMLDRTGGADSYYAPAAMIPPGRIPPGAAGRSMWLIGDQYFYQA